jgi:hypothetical protein
VLGERGDGLGSQFGSYGMDGAKISEERAACCARFQMNKCLLRQHFKILLF